MLPLDGRRATVMGLGSHGGGAESARYLARQGALVTVTDLAPAERLQAALQSLAGEPIDRYRLGRHDRADFAEADIVLVNPAVRRDDPYLLLAEQSGAQITTDIQLLLNACPAPIIAVTGSNGKSTTSAMIAGILEAEGRRTWLGGNIGRSLLPELDQIVADNWVVLELSSFQLAHLRQPRRMPPIAVVTNCSANHLDWHPDYDDYRCAKQRLIAWQSPSDTAVLNTLDPEVAAWDGVARGRLCPLLEADALPTLLVPGAHNVANARCAATATLAAGCSTAAIELGLSRFAGLRHRLQCVAELEGRCFYNDSMATTPESVIAALAALDRPVWLLAGGKDKGGDLGALGEAISRQARGACFYGATRQRLQEAVTSAQEFGRCETACRESLPAALEWCWERSQAGEAIVLSPACSSFDQFRDYAHRAEVFVAGIEHLKLAAAR